jgi:hypothetical protein
MVGGRQRIASFQSDFYRDNYHKMLRQLIVATMIMLLLVVTIIYFILTSPPTKYYGTTTQGQIIPMIPVGGQ